MDLANFLVAMGAKIDGIGSTRLKLKGYSNSTPNTDNSG